MTPEEVLLALFAQGFIVIGTDPEDPRIDVGISDRFYSIAGSRFRITLNGDDVILADASKLQAFIPFIPRIREVGDEDSNAVTPLDSVVSYKRTDSATLDFDAPDTFSLGHPLEVFNLSEGPIQLVGLSDSFLDGSLTSTLIVGAYKSVRLSVQDLPGAGKVFMVASKT